jgi:hypothetical protein
MQRVTPQQAAGSRQQAAAEDVPHFSCLIYPLIRYINLMINFISIHLFKSSRITNYYTHGGKRNNLPLTTHIRYMSMLYPYLNYSVMYLHNIEVPKDFEGMKYMIKERVGEIDRLSKKFFFVVTSSEIKFVNERDEEVKPTYNDLRRDFQEYVECLTTFHPVPEDNLFTKLKKEYHIVNSMLDGSEKTKTVSNNEEILVERKALGIRGALEGGRSFMYASAFPRCTESSFMNLERKKSLHFLHLQCKNTALPSLSMFFLWKLNQKATLTSKAKEFPLRGELHKLNVTPIREYKIVAYYGKSVNCKSEDPTQRHPVGVRHPCDKPHCDTKLCKISDTSCGKPLPREVLFNLTHSEEVNGEPTIFLSPRDLDGKQQPLYAHNFLFPEKLSPSEGKIHKKATNFCNDENILPKIDDKIINKKQ